MAGGKLSPRQKMINLMYLVFIAMLALTMSKKVLTSFGRVYEDLKESVQLYKLKNQDQIAQLAAKAQEQPQKYGDKYRDAQALDKLTNDFQQYMDKFEKEVFKAYKQDPKKPDYEVLDKGYRLDEMFFKGEGLLPKGKEFLNKVREYHKSILEFANKYGDQGAIERVNKRFTTDDVKVKGEGKEDWMHYTFEDFPAIASITNMARLENNAMATENELLSSMFQGQLISDVSFKNYKPFIMLDKSAFFPNEHVKGKVILGRYDKTMTFEKAEINGKPVSPEQMQNGQVLIDLPAGNPGDKDLKGFVEFKEGDSIVKLPFEYTYSVIPMPNSAVISADKMNVVYKGVDNPLSISVPGIPDNKVKVSAPGLRKIKAGKYVVNVSNYRGRTIDIVVSWTLPNGQHKQDKKTFRVKNIPPPVGTFSGQDGYVKLPKHNIEIGSVGAKLPDFDFDVKLVVTGFDFKAPGQPTIRVSGTRLNARAKSALRRVRKGQTVQIFNIKTKLVGSSIKLSKTSIVTIEVSN